MEKRIIRVAAVIIKNKALLLVTGHGADFFWTPGGKVDEGEDLISALDREVSEELGVKVKKSEPYITYISFQEEDGSTREVTCFFVEYEGEPKAKGEIEKMVWISRQDIKENKVKIQSGIADHLIPKLLKDGFL